MRRIKLPSSVIVRAPGLLHMWYTSSELVTELSDLGTDDPEKLPLKHWIVLGLPHRRDARGHLWFDGHVVAQWIKQQRQKPTRQKIAADETYCFHCQAVRVFKEPIVHSQRGKQIIYRGVCITCGHDVNKAAKAQETN